MDYPLIFISYRQNDSLDLASHLDESLTVSFGEAAVFRDQTRLVGGDKWTEKLESYAAACSVMLVLIGPGWKVAKYSDRDREGMLRLHDPEDWVRKEITLALTHKCLVIPVLLNDTQMPTRRWLESCSLVQLVDHQTVKLRSSDYEQDLENILSVLQSKCPDLRASANAEADEIDISVDFLRINYEILDAAFFDEVAAKVEQKQARTQILKLGSANWSMLFQKSYVRRDQQDTALNLALELSQSTSISIMLIRGRPGAGKTALLRWLAHELFQQGKRVFHLKGSAQIDWLEELRTFSEMTKGGHFYVSGDDLFRSESFVDELQKNEFLFPLTIIGTTRSNEDQHDELEGTEYQIACLDMNKPSAAEKERVLDLPEIKVRIADKTVSERRELMDSPVMLVLMLQLSEGKNFDRILKDIVKALPNSESQPLYQAFGILCSFFQHGIVVPFEILKICLPNLDYLDRLILTELEGLVDIASVVGYEGLMPIHELIATTVMSLDYRITEGGNPPYRWITPSLLMKNFEKVVADTDMNSNLQSRWLGAAMRILLKTSEKNLVIDLIEKYSSTIDNICSRCEINSLSSWLVIYEAVGRLDRQKRAIQKAISSLPEEASEWEYWLFLTEKFGNAVQVKEAILQMRKWLVLNPDARHAKGTFLALIEREGSDTQVKEAILQTQEWLTLNPEDQNVRTRFLALLEREGQRYASKGSYSSNTRMAHSQS